MFIILKACLAETHGIGAVKPVSTSMFTKITKLDSQTGEELRSLNVMNTENRFFCWPDKTHELDLNPEIVGQFLLDWSDWFHLPTQFWK